MSVLLVGVPDTSVPGIYVTRGPIDSMGVIFFQSTQN